MDSIEIIGVKIEKDIEPGDDIPELIIEALNNMNIKLEERDILVICQKIISKAKGFLFDASKVKPSPKALELARKLGKKPGLIEFVLRQSKSIFNIWRRVIITETHHGLICPNAGIDKSNVKGENWYSFLPPDPDMEAQKIREEIGKRLGVYPAVIITDTMSRPFRRGQVNFAIGVAGMAPLLDYRGKSDMYGKLLRITIIAIADEIAAAAELVMGKTKRCPVAIVRNYKYPRSEQASAKELIVKLDEDMFL